ncbi:MAG: hypothetical protein ACKO2Q_05145, partial [Actinomycetota bacterium]
MCLPGVDHRAFLAEARGVWGAGPQRGGDSRGRVDNAVFLTAKAVKEGDLTGGFKTFDLKTDGVGYATSGGYLDDVVAQLEELKAKVISGE